MTLSLTASGLSPMTIESGCGNTSPPDTSSTRTTPQPEDLASPSILSATQRRHISLGKSDAFFALVDAIDYDALHQLAWHMSFSRNWYAKRAVILGTLRGKRIRQHFYMHRDVLLRAKAQPLKLDVSGQPMKLVSDHQNGRSLDCRRENLRWLTVSENRYNIHRFHPQTNGSPTYRKPVWQDPETAALIFEGE